MVPPDHRYLRAKKIAEAGYETLDTEVLPLVEILHDKMDGVPLVEDSLVRALEIYLSDKQSKYLMEALLMAPDGTPERLCEVMRCKRDLVDHYKKYFFDTTVFLDGFDQADYISELTNDRSRISKKQALTQGFSFVISNFTGNDLDLGPIEVCKRMQSYAYGMANQARGMAVTSEIAKEAKQWAAVVKSFTDVLAKHDEVDHGNFFSEFTVIMSKGSDIKEMDAATDVVRG